MYIKFTSDYTVGHKNMYLEFPSFMGVLQKKTPTFWEIYLPKQTSIYTHLL